MIPKQRPQGLSKRGKFAKGYYQNKAYQPLLNSIRFATAMERLRNKWPKLNSNIAIAAVISLADERGGDIDNLAGALMDGIGRSDAKAKDGAVYDDDRRVVALVAIRNSPKLDYDATVNRLREMLDGLADEAPEGDNVILLVDGNE